MKPYTYSLLAAALACGMAQGAATAYTTPVGYVTHSIAGNTLGGVSGADTFLAPALVHADSFAGQTTVSPSGGNVATFQGSVPVLDNTYLLEITAGAKEGWWSVVTSSTTTTITTTDNFPASLPADVKISVKRITTLKDFVGANLPGLSQVDGVNPNPPDEVQIFDPTTQSTKSAAFVTTGAGVGADGWYDLGSQLSLDDEPIYPGTSVKVRRFAASALSFTSSGTVKLTNTEVDIYPRANWVGQTLAIGTDLDGLGIASQINQEDGDPQTTPFADQLEVLNPTTQATTVNVALAATLGGGIFDVGSQAPSGTTPIPEGTGLIISRDPTAPASTIVMPKQIVTP